MGGPQSEPQPDVVLFRYQEDCYTAQPPKPEDVLLLVEVADSSLLYDRDVKIPLYAESAVQRDGTARPAQATAFANPRGKAAPLEGALRSPRSLLRRTQILLGNARSAYRILMVALRIRPHSSRNRRSSILFS
ncbi:MAG TPA: Uma2 family endonuclease [Thermoanaerobaculia bacterium]|nr:Uma2 family endonuclease [Thermoanaerobaculia bacterium]